MFSAVDAADPALPWPDRLRLTAQNLYREFSRHPAICQAIVSDQSNPTSSVAMRTTEDMMGALFEAGFDVAQARQALIAVNGLVFGVLALSTSGYSLPPRPAASASDMFARVIDPTRLPHLARVQAIDDADATIDFDCALDLVIDGLISAAAPPLRTP